MRLVLNADVSGLGSKGDVVDVSNGYGRNYLLPQGLAAKATAGMIRQIQESRRAAEEVRRRELEKAENLRLQLSDTRIVIAARTGDEGRLFGSIGVSQVIDAVRSLSQVALDRSMVFLPEPIKTIGFHEVTITLDPEVTFPLVLDVIPA